MRKFLLAATALLALALPAAAAAQDTDPHGGCITIDMVMARAEDLQLKVFYTLRGADIGYEDKVDITIFEVVTDTHSGYLALAFERGCYVAEAMLDQEGVETLINDNTKKAGGA